MAEYFRHYKGGVYRLLYTARNSETLEELVVYQAMYGDRAVWVRPKSMFFEKILKDGALVDRFAAISAEEALTMV